MAKCLASIMQGNGKMARLVNTSVFILTFLLWASSPPASAAIEKKDIILLLENSQSMQENDPEFLTQKFVLNFINGLRGDSQIAIILFDGGTSVAMPLVPVSQKTRDALVTNLDKLTYTGRFRNSAAGMERALYELKNFGRPQAEKAIILLTNGPIETGDEKRDRDFSRWMQEYLAHEAAEAGIKVFGIAFTEAADFHLLQILAHTTGGTYYRAPQAVDLQSAFNRIRKVITPTSTAPAAPAIDIPKLKEPPVPESTESPQAPLGAENQLPSPPQQDAEEGASPSLGNFPWLQPYLTRLKAEWKWIAAIAGLMLAAIFIVTALLKRSRRTTAPVAPAGNDSRKYIPPAQLEGLTRPSHYDITGKLAWISRAPGENSKDTATICIQDDVISRDHALIQYRDNAYWISDRGSINGTFVNDEKITGERALHDGDRIRFAKYEFRFILPHRTDMADTMLIQSDHSDDRTELIDLDDRTSPQPTAPSSDNAPPQDDGDEEATIIRPVQHNGPHR